MSPVQTLANLSEITAVAFNVTVQTDKDMRRLHAHLTYQHDRWLNKFKTIIMSINGNQELFDELKKNTEEYLPGYEFVWLYSENLGKYLGNADNTNKIFNYSATRKDIEYIFKLSGDVIGDHLDSIEIDTDYDFFYIDNIPHSMLTKHKQESLLNQIYIGEYFSPVNHFYVIKNKLTILTPDTNELLQLKNSGFEDAQTDTEQLESDICNEWLADLVKANKLKIKNLLNENDLKNLIDTIFTYEAYNSHKNIVYTNIGSICHFHYEQSPVIDIPYYV